LHDAPPDVPEGWHVHVGDGFYFFATDNWKIPAEVSDFDDPDALRNLSNPAVSHGMSKPVEASRAGASVFIVDTSSRQTIGEARTQLVVKKERGGKTNIGIEVEALRKEVPAIVSESPLELPVGPAHEFVTLRKTIGGDEIHEIWIVLVDERDVYTFRFTATGTNVPLMQIARPALQTFRRGTPPPGALPAEIENPFQDLSDLFGTD
jgi:hypothetical protein